jgi:hypothetical protein
MYNALFYVTHFTVLLQNVASHNVNVNLVSLLLNVAAHNVEVTKRMSYKM